MNFSTLTSVVRTTKTVHPRLSEVQCHIFDIIYEDAEGVPYEKRYNLLANAYTKYLEDRGTTTPMLLHVVPCQVAATHHDVLAHHAQYVSAGYEGLMVKKVSNGASHDSVIFAESLYKGGVRCNHILKYKAFQDEEATILEVTLTGSILMLEVQDVRGNRFTLRMRSDVHSDVASLRGKAVTYRYQKLSPTAVPLDAIGIAIRDYE